MDNLNVKRAHVLFYGLPYNFPYLPYVRSYKTDDYYDEDDFLECDFCMKSGKRTDFEINYRIAPLVDWLLLCGWEANEYVCSCGNIVDTEVI